MDKVNLGFSGSRYIRENGIDKPFEIDIDNFIPAYFKQFITQTVHGGAIGADNSFDIWSKDNNFKIEVIKPDYKNNHPKVAPIIRNKKIVSKCDILLAIASHSNSRGTISTVNFARDVKKPYIYFYKEDNLWLGKYSGSLIKIFHHDKNADIRRELNKVCITLNNSGK